MKALINQKSIAGLLIILISLLLTLFLHVSGSLELLEMKTFDTRLQLSEQNVKANDKIVIVDIDNASLESMKPLVGRWPWPRSLYGDLLEFLAVSGAEAVLFDVTFTELQKPRNEDGELGEDDFILADSTAANEKAIHAARFLKDTEDEINKSLLNRPLPESFSDRFSLKNIDVRDDTGILKTNVFYLPFAELYDAAAGIGIVDFDADDDGVYRQSHLLREYQGLYFPAHSLSLFQYLFPAKTIELTGDALKIGSFSIPLQRDGKYLINMKKEFNTYSIGGIFASIQKLQAGDEENLIFKPEDFTGKIIIIGASASGVDDLKQTAIGDEVPGVWLHGSIISNLLDRDFIKTRLDWEIFLILFIICLGITFMILRFQSVTVQILIPAAMILIYLLSSYLLFDYYRLWIPVIAPLIAFAGVFIGSYTFMSLTEGKERRKTRKMLSQYVSPAVLSEVMDKSDSVLTAEVGTTEELTILFSDIRGFTSFSESTEPTQVVEQLNYYLKEMVDIVFDFKGTLDKFIGDAVMAFWGAPVMSKTHAKDAVLTALEMNARLIDINTAFREKDYPQFKIGVGLNTGSVILGNIGSDKKLDYTIIGDNVNLASRLEGLTKEYGCDVIISESTFQQIDSDIPCRIVDSVRVKGKEQPIQIYHPLCSPQDSAEKLEFGLKLEGIANSAFRHYQAQEFKAAIDAYEEVLQIRPHDMLSEMMIERCRQFLESPPPEKWDGCYTMKTK